MGGAAFGRPSGGPPGAMVPMEVPEWSAALADPEYSGSDPEYSGSDPERAESGQSDTDRPRVSTDAADALVRG